MDKHGALRSLAVFMAGGVTTSIAAAGISPSTFNFSREGLLRVATLAAAGAFTGLGAFFLRSPFSPLNVTENKQVVKQDAAGNTEVATTQTTVTTAAK